MKFIIKPFSEIIVKSKPVRKRYMDFLQTNCNLALKRINNTLKVKNYWDKLELDIENSIFDNNSEIIIKTLLRLPWIESFIEVVEYPLLDVDDILDKSIFLYKDDIFWKSFVVRVRRSWIHNFKSIDLERFLWGWILKHITWTRVDLHNPDFTLNIEIKNDKVFFVKNKYIWIGWYPVWTQDKVISLISGWFDSSVSTYSMIKRWCKVDYLFFNLWWRDHELWVKQVSYHIWKNFSAWYRAKFITVNFEEIVEFLVKNINHRFRWIILKRLFLMCADQIAKNNEYYWIIKWDSLWQVSSQTLKNLFVIDKASDTLVLRPLISFNKQEIINQSMKIWTYEYSCWMPEYCAVISDKPATWARLEQVLNEENKFPKELLEKSLSEIKVDFIDNVIEKEKENAFEVEISYICWENEVIIDIREEPIEQLNPLKVDKTEVIKMPFFDIMYDFPLLDQSKVYLLYCDKGIMSRNYALNLKEKWFNNIKIYRPFLNNWCEIKLK